MEAKGKPRGRRKAVDSLTKDQIAAAALELVIRDGIDRFSVRALAKRLGVGAATIYWHAQSRDDLLVAAWSHAFKDYTAPPPREDWRAWFRELFRGYRGFIQKNRNISKLSGVRLIGNAGIGRNYIEAILANLVRAGFDERNIVDAYNIIQAAMVGFVTMELAPEPEVDPAAREKVRQSVNTVNVERHPHTARFLPLLANRAFTLRWENGSTVPLDSSFEALIEVILRGLTALLEDAGPRSGGHDGPCPTP